MPRGTLFSVGVSRVPALRPDPENWFRGLRHVDVIPSGGDWGRGGNRGETPGGGDVVESGALVQLWQLWAGVRTGKEGPLGHGSSAWQAWAVLVRTLFFAAERLDRLP